MISKIIKIFLVRLAKSILLRLLQVYKIFLNMEPFCQEHQLPPRASRPASHQPEPLPDHSFVSDGGEAWTAQVQPLLLQPRVPKSPTGQPVHLCILDSESDRDDDEEADSESSETSDYHDAVAHRRPHLLICLA